MKKLASGIDLGHPMTKHHNGSYTAVYQWGTGDRAVATFDNRPDARAYVTKLVALGIDRSSLTVRRWATKSRRHNPK